MFPKRRREPTEYQIRVFVRTIVVLMHHKVIRPKRPRVKHLKFQGRNNHHLTNRCRGGYGKKRGPNGLLIRIPRHNELHRYFGNLEWEKIGVAIANGTMMNRLKFRGLSEEEVGDILFSIFTRRDPAECAQVVWRVSRAKGRMKQREYEALTTKEMSVAA